MKQAEIQFCERWLELRGADGLVLWTIGTELGDLAEYGEPQVTNRIRGEVGAEQLLDLTPRGADLVASYEAALAQGLRIVADDPSPVIDAILETDLVDCPTCDAAGRVQISKLNSDRDMVELVEGADGRPDETGKVAANVLPGWDVRCPTCKGARLVEAEDGKSGLLERVVRKYAHTLGIGWIQWSAETAALVNVGDLIEARNMISLSNARESIVRAVKGTQLCTADWQLRPDATWQIRILERAQPDPDLGWQKLTPEVAARLEGKVVESRSSAGTMHGVWRVGRFTSVHDPETGKRVNGMTGYVSAELRRHLRRPP